MGRNRLVMIIDPEADSRSSVAGLLRDAPFAVVAGAGYGEDAAAIAAEAQPEIVVAAVEEPVEDALRTIGQLTATLPQAVIVGYSSLTEMRLIRQVLQSGIRDLLPRPLDQSELLAALDATEGAPPVSATTPSEAPAPTPVPTRGTVMAVFGAKGGIGKSTIATSLSASIALDTDRSVLVMDMDTRFGDIAIMLDMEPRFTISDVAEHANSLERDSFRRALMEHESGAFVLAAPKHPSEWANVTADQMKAIVEFAAHQFDYVILDTPGTFNDIVATSIEVADRVLVVSSLDMASIKDTVHMLDLLEAEGYPQERLLLVINQVNRATTVKVTDVPRIVHQDVFWSIPYDEHVLLANSLGSPIVMTRPKSAAAKQLRALALKITTGQVVEPRSLGRGLRSLLTPWTFLTRRRAAA